MGDGAARGQIRDATRNTDGSTERSDFLHQQLRKTNCNNAPNLGKQKGRGAMFQKTPLRCPEYSPLGHSTSCKVVFTVV